MSRSVMDLKDVCLELCASGILMKALKLVKLPNYRSLDPVEFFIRMSHERSGSKANVKGRNTDQKISMLLPGRVY